MLLICFFVDGDRRRDGGDGGGGRLRSDRVPDSGDNDRDRRDGGDGDRSSDRRGDDMAISIERLFSDRRGGGDKVRGE